MVHQACQAEDRGLFLVVDLCVRPRQCDRALIHQIQQVSIALDQELGEVCLRFGLLLLLFDRSSFEAGARETS